jgi:hypothetical protein
MAGSLSTVGFDLQPTPKQQVLASNYLTDFNFLDQYLPDVKEEEFEKYGDRTVASFLRMVGAEMPFTSDLIKWVEQGRLHIKYVDCASDGAATDATATITVNDSGLTKLAIRKNQTVHLSVTGGSLANRAIVTAVDYTAGTFDVAYYESGGQTFAATDQLTVFVYGSEFGKGASGMEESLEAESNILENKPLILKDNYEVNGSDMAQIGWVNVTTENGADGFLWFLKSEHETRLRFEDYLETSLLEAVPMENTTNSNVADGSDGLFYSVENRGNVWSGGNPSTLAEFDTIVQALDKEGAIEENVIFNNREFGFDIDDMLAGVSNPPAASFGLFDNDIDMALNLGFDGFRRGYDFYKSDLKYFNHATMRGGITGDKISGIIMPAGSTTVYDQVLGKNARRPHLHVRYRASEAIDRKMQTWITGGQAGAPTNDIDAMRVNFLSERALCTLGANNFFLVKG